jgi:hypothetical protein
MNKPLGVIREHDPVERVFVGGKVGEKLSSVEVVTVTGPCWPPRSKRMMMFSCKTSSSLNALLRESNRCMWRMAARSRMKSRNGR